MKKTLLHPAILSALLALPALAESTFIPLNVTTGLALGTLSGEAKERVYDPEEGGRKISQLNWKYQNAAVIKGHIDWHIMPYLSLGASGWNTLAGRGAYMHDYDWEDASQKSWTDHSWHPNTRLNNAYQFDLNATGWIFNQPDWRLGVMAGYQQSHYSFTARGGNYSYDNGSDVGEEDPRVKGISYQQNFKMPYIGLTGSYTYSNIELAGAFKYSGWVRSADTDHHHLTSTLFNGKIRNQNYYGLEGSIGYWVTPQAKIALNTAWTRVANKKGSIKAHNYDEDTLARANNASGIEHYNLVTSVGLSYRF
ncbi:omptin family outer membrane protease [Shimwellia blattae]|nr:omptin family outer membrane protease [Shimwellia blattae]GAB82416.1 protease VII [Shimwellia blattae DSM 4481 = NBRC 105725]VDY64412.1 Outer membrane protease ompP precursor [Shimwellia blattae]VEC22525.1 Outer membrane protease ompP precursor [Shimwellia blattae]